MSGSTSLLAPGRVLALLGCAWSLSSVALLPACTPAQAAPALAAPQRVVTGNADYDRFFAQVSELWHSVETAEHELPDAQAALARRVGLPESASVDAVGARLRERTAHLALEGLTLELEFAGLEAADGAEDGASESGSSASATSIPSQPPPTPTATLRTPGREPERRELRLLEVVAQAALSAATVYADMGALPRRTRPLEESAGALRAGLAGAFPDAGQRARIQADLDRAQAALEQLNERSRRVASSADTLVSLLDEAANTATGNSAARRRPPREAPKSPGPPASSPAPATERPSRPPASKPAADRARDFEP
ncbi:MAG TPA: hypothetical protein VFS67_05185 [Polyangiaceae bacterium]|nr:hypothetical protein [Polyangiaceae bacterium]